LSSDFCSPDPYRDAKHYPILDGTSKIQRLVNGRALAAETGEPPLHHGFPSDGPAIAGKVGRGAPGRISAGMAGMKAVRNMPEPVRRAVMRAVAPPEPPPRKRASS
jgi:hypothetical protein